MITLYVNPTCPFCIRTLEVAHELHVPLTVKDVHDAGVAEELVSLGGKKQMPYLRDEERAVSMYESDNIIAYLKETFSQPA